MALADFYSLLPECVREDLNRQLLRAAYDAQEATEMTARTDHYRRLVVLCDLVSRWTGVDAKVIREQARFAASGMDAQQILDLTAVLA